ncbi:MAG: DUF4136 domain-containing protein [Bacteroidota bacterium]|nr:DUF4136 domain-containing protein [Bacteroidota bacterium]
MKSKNVMWLMILALGALFTSCTKDPVSNLTDDESRIYITDHDSTASFAAYKTFSISDSVAVINNGRASKDLTAADQGYVNAVKSQMQAQGFTLVSKTARPDLGINVSRIYNTSTGVVSYQNYYGTYGGFYDPYYWGYGGYGYYSPYSYATYAITEGALSIDILDLKDAPSANRINLVWTGLIRGSGIFNSANANSQVKMLFDQSPYLKNQ